MLISPQSMDYLASSPRMGKLSKAQNVMRDICFYLRVILIGRFTLKMNGLFWLAVKINAQHLFWFARGFNWPIHFDSEWALLIGCWDKRSTFAPSIGRLSFFYARERGNEMHSELNFFSCPEAIVSLSQQFVHNWFEQFSIHGKMSINAVWPTWNFLAWAMANSADLFTSAVQPASINIYVNQQLTTTGQKTY